MDPMSQTTEYTHSKLFNADKRDLVCVTQCVIRIITSKVWLDYWLDVLSELNLLNICAVAVQNAESLECTFAWHESPRPVTNWAMSNDVAMLGSKFSVVGREDAGLRSLFLMV